MKIVEPACSSLMSMFEPFFHGRSVDTGAIGSLDAALARRRILRVDADRERARERLQVDRDARLELGASAFPDRCVKNLMKPSGISEASAPIVGKSLPGRLKLMPNGLGTILRMRISSTSPGSAPFTKIGPVTECGPPPGFALRSSTICSIVMPGCTLSCECIIVSIETVSPELTVSFGGSFGSSQPHCTVSSVAASV